MARTRQTASRWEAIWRVRVEPSTTLFLVPRLVIVFWGLGVVVPHDQFHFIH